MDFAKIREALTEMAKAGQSAEKALAGLSVVEQAFATGSVPGVATGAQKGTLTPEGRRSIQEGQRRRWNASRRAKFVEAAESQIGKPYEWGAEADGQEDPEAFDCSELVQWAAEKAGVDFVDGSQTQRRKIIPCDLDTALVTSGALLFTSSHVAISTGDGRTIEARNKRDGVGVFQPFASYEACGFIPGMEP